MIYVVSGQPRSGTSAMMQFLIAGGIGGFYSKADSDSNGRDAAEDGYVYCPGGNFEPTQSVTVGEHHGKPGADGKCAKVIADALAKTMQLCDRDKSARYRVVLMTRRADEVALSRERCDMTRPPRKTTEQVMAELKAHPGVEGVVLVDYADLVDNPVRVGEKLAEVGWPIDPQAAAQAIKPELYRNRCR